MKINIRVEVNRTDTDRQTITLEKSHRIKLALLCDVSVTVAFGQSILSDKVNSERHNMHIIISCFPFENVYKDRRNS